MSMHVISDARGLLRHLSFGCDALVMLQLPWWQKKTVPWVYDNNVQILGRCGHWCSTRPWMVSDYSSFSAHCHKFAKF